MPPEKVVADPYKGFSTESDLKTAARIYWPITNM